MKPRSLTCGSWSSTVTTGLRRMTALSMSHLPCGESACEVWKLPSSLRKSQAHSEKSLCTKLGSRRMRVPSECSRTVTPQRQLGELCKRSVHVWSPFFSPFWIDLRIFFFLACNFCYRHLPFSIQWAFLLLSFVSLLICFACIPLLFFSLH